MARMKKKYKTVLLMWFTSFMNEISQNKYLNKNSSFAYLDISYQLKVGKEANKSSSDLFWLSFNNEATESLEKK